MNNSNLVLNITHDDYDQTFEEKIRSFYDLSEGFDENLPSMFLTSDKSLNTFKNALINVYPDLKGYDFSFKKIFYQKWECKDIKLYINKSKTKTNSYAIYCCTKGIENLQTVWNIYKAIVQKNEDSLLTIYMTKYYYYNDGVCERQKLISKEDYDVSKDVYPYIDTDLMFDRFFNGDENLLLLVGESGLGKSKLASLAVKYLLENGEELSNVANVINIATVQNNDVLVCDEFWNSLEENAIKLVLIDDLDFMLTKRDTDVQGTDDLKKNTFISKFLPFTDGITKSKVKFIITTNQSYENLDQAVLRKGRLFDILELRRLSHNEAKSLWLKSDLQEKDFEKIFKDNILVADLCSEIHKRKKNIKSVSVDKEYLKEQSISKVTKAKTHKRIGL